MSTHRTTFASLIAVVAISGAALTGCSVASSAAPEGSVEVVSAHQHADHDDELSAEIALYTTMRDLWGEHMEWTWSTVVAFATESPALQPVLDRLLKNQEDLGAAVGTFYGEDAGDQVTALLKTHINQAVPVLVAAKAGDTAALNTAVKDWYANARDIADFLAAANPNLPKNVLRDMMKMHIDTTIAYASAAIAGDWGAAVAAYDTAEQHMDEMADALSAGIIAQFPDRF